MEKATCEECKKEYSPVIEGIPFCAKCDEKNWVDANSPEGQELLAKDPNLRLGIISPYK